MDQLSASHENADLAARNADPVLLAQKRQIQALKRILIAKAEVRRVKSLIGRRRVGTR